MQEKAYKILEHPSDLKIQIFGKTKDELFLNALRAMADVLSPEIQDTEQEIRNKIEVYNLNLDNLLVDFLNEILYLSQVNKRVYNNIKFFKFSDKGLQGELVGYNVEKFGEDIKAATYHKLKIEKKNNLYQAVVLFDI